MDHEITEMALLAAQFVNSTAHHVFLTGKAGTGKTTFLHQLAQNTHKRYLILAPTGIAALNARGVTIHSQFLLPFGSFIPEPRLPEDIPEYGRFHDRDTLTRRHPLNAVRRSVLRSVDLIIIDEVSMLRADLLDAIDHRLRNVRGIYDRPFGGVQLLLIGDLYQLPPVVKDEEWRVLCQWYTSPHFFASRAIRQAGYAHIELDRIFRQQDARFIEILNNLRNNTVTAEDVRELNVHYRATIPKADSAGVITLTTHNRSADELNRSALNGLPGKLHVFHADLAGEFPESMYPVSSALELKVGAQVMFIRNDAEKAYYNGKLAKVTALDEEGISVEMERPANGRDAREEYVLKKEVWENKRYIVDPVTKEQKEEVLGTYTQFPIKLAWAITVHKSQGLTFDKAIIDVGSAFAPGQVYVALSRLRSLDGLILRTRIDPSVVATDKDVVAFSEERFNQQPLKEQLKDRQQTYLEAILSSTFDLGDIIKKTGFVLRDHSEIAGFEDEAMRTALEHFAAKLRAEEANTNTFRAQLLRLLRDGDRETLHLRLAKGSAYYSGILKESMKQLLQHLAQVELLSRTKEYGAELREIDGMLVKKLTMIANVDHISTCLLSGVAVERKPELENMLNDQRTSLVAEVARWVADNKPRTSTKSGRKRTAKGEEGVFATRKKGKAIKGETYLKTYALIKNGLDLAAVAAERGLSVGTIHSHCARGIEEGIISIPEVMDDTSRDIIADWMREHADRPTNEARQHFGDRFSYGELKMVQAWLKVKER